MMLRIILQVIGVVLLIPLVTIATLKIYNQNADGPSILFPGGELVSGELHTGPDPDWSFTDDVPTIELQLVNPLSSRTIFIMESGGKVYIPSGYMRSFLGRIWKDWAFQADEGDGLAVARISGVRYERQLIRIKDGDVIEGVAAKLAQKYFGGTSPEAVAGIKKSVMDGDTWVFEMAARDGARM
jgi:hypothetical protein|tara:strand:- start:3293 stop:3844 length:552 start_codon:yes stop_codon:yes gene_type:complete